MRATTRLWRHFDIWLLAAVVLLTIAGIAMIRSAIGGNENLAITVSRQSIFAVLGLAVVLIFAAIDYRFFAAIARPLYLATSLFLAFIFVAGQVGFGSARWFQIATVNIQPSEVAKITAIIVLSGFFAHRQNQMGQLKTILQSLALVALPALLILLQPDLSTAIVLLVIWASLVWAAGLQLRHIGILVLIAVIAVLMITPFLANYFMHDYAQGQDFYFLKWYQMERVANFLFPDPDESFGSTYNVDQALISIGSGGWLGQGYGQGTQVQLRFLKVRHTDFIFSAMAEEFGFVGAMLLLILFMFVIYRCIRAASIARDRFGALICYGVAFSLLFQGAFNIGMNLNLFPVSGLPLPFFSYGGSSLVASLMGIGLVESVILRHKTIEL